MTKLALKAGGAAINRGWESGGEISFGDHTLEHLGNAHLTLEICTFWKEKERSNH